MATAESSTDQGLVSDAEGARKAKQRERNKRYRATHREQLHAYDRAYGATHREQRRINHRTYHRAHRDKIRAYRAANREKLNAQKRASRAANRDTVNARERARRAANAVSRREKARRWRAAHPEKHRAYVNAWHRKHPEARQAIEQRRRAREKALPATLTVVQWETILAHYQYRCVFCPPTCWRCRRRKHALEQEHLTPLFHGGGTTLHNIVPACGSCNRKKHTGPPPVPVQPLLL